MGVAGREWKKEGFFMAFILRVVRKRVEKNRFL